MLNPKTLREPEAFFSLYLGNGRLFRPEMSTLESSPDMLSMQATIRPRSQVVQSLTCADALHWIFQYQIAILIAIRAGGESYHPPNEPFIVVGNERRSGRDFGASLSGTSAEGEHLATTLGAF